VNVDARATSLGIRAARGALMALIVLGLLPARSLAHATAPQDQFWTVLAPAMTPLAGWRLHGVAPDGDGRLRLAPSPTPLPCVRADVDGGVTSYDPAAGLCSGRDPYRPGGYHGRTYYTGARFRYGTLLAPPQTVGPFDHAIASWVAATPPGTWLEAHLRVLLETGVWTRWYALPIWASGTESVRRHSIEARAAPRRSQPIRWRCCVAASPRPTSLRSRSSRLVRPARPCAASRSRSHARVRMRRAPRLPPPPGGAMCRCRRARIGRPATAAAPMVEAATSGAVRPPRR
jgi:hypothetical protein